MSIVNKYYKINISESQENFTFKCYKVIKKKEEKTEVISYNLKELIEELSMLEKTKKENDMTSIFKIITVGIFSIFVLRIYSEFYL